MDFENIVISPPDYYRFLNLIPIVENDFLITGTVLDWIRS